VVGPLTGKTFGKWSIGEKVDSHPTYLCTCSCGRTGKIRGSHLLNGMSTQCGGCRNKLPRPGSTFVANGGTKNTCKRGHVVGLVGTAKSGMCQMCRWSTYILREYGLTIEEYKALYDLQLGKCAICGKKLSLNKAFGEPEVDAVRSEIDHKHIPKKLKPQPSKRSTVRGLLCGGRYAGCNRKLGHVDDVTWLRAAAEYLSDPPAARIKTTEVTS
jgi:hypothetical protein